MTVRFWILIAVIVALVAGGIFAIPRLEGTPPVISELPTVELGKTARTVVVNVSDEGSGLRAVSLRVDTADGSKVLAERHFPGSMTAGGDAFDERIEISLDVAELGLPDGEATLTLTARDWSLRDGFAGNSVEVSSTITVDTQPPTVRAHAGLIYVYRGGSGAVRYTLGEPAAQHGVRVDDAFFPGHPADPDDPMSLERVAIFAIPVDADPNPQVLVIARDAAGNESSASFAVRVFDRQFSSSTITLSQGFLDNKSAPLAEAAGLTASNAGESFKNVNETLRARNEARIREIVSTSSPLRHWKGAFAQMPNSAVTSQFADRRTYHWNSRPVSKATHFGFDLASTRGAPITASNGGVVVLAEDLGIYGQCVIIDHGLGVHSLYGHLSQMDAAVGDTVKKGQSLGRSGATGLAGGDHLHFAILVGGEYVDPLEWWDPKWIRSHVEASLQTAADPG